MNGFLDDDKGNIERGIDFLLM